MLEELEKCVPSSGSDELEEEGIEKLVIKEVRQALNSIMALPSCTTYDEVFNYISGIASFHNLFKISQELEACKKSSEQAETNSDLLKN